jgi:hypothetical protein
MNLYASRLAYFTHLNLGEKACVESDAHLKLIDSQPLVLHAQWETRRFINLTELDEADSLPVRKQK